MSRENIAFPNDTYKIVTQANLIEALSSNSYINLIKLNWTEKIIFHLNGEN